MAKIIEKMAKNDTQPHQLSIFEAGRAMRSGRLSSRTLVENSLSRIKQYDSEINSFITVTEDFALARADEADVAFARGEDRGPMQGIPYALKDIFDTKGILTTCHSKLLQSYIPDTDSAVTEILNASGAVLVGKLSTYEFATGGPSFDLPWPPARNPWNRDYFTGGSSSGSGAAVAAGFVRMAIGSDTAGSIRGPAAYCGVVGLKPTYGLVSRRGAFPLAHTMDHIGPLARSVKDCAITMQAIVGHDPLDPASVELSRGIDFVSELNKGIAGMKLGLVRGFYHDIDGVSSEVVTAIEKAVGILTGLGAVIEEVELPDYNIFSAIGQIILRSESYAIHERDLRNRPEDYGRYAYARIASGFSISASDYIQALRARRKLARVVNGTVLSSYDALITASALAPALRFDEFDNSRQPPSLVQTIPFNVIGNPAMSIPTGFSSEGLPLAMQIICRPFDDAKVLRIGAAYEAATLDHLRWPENLGSSKVIS